MSPNPYVTAAFTCLIHIYIIGRSKKAPISGAHSLRLHLLFLLQTHRFQPPLVYWPANKPHPLTDNGLICLSMF